MPDLSSDSFANSSELIFATANTVIVAHVHAHLFSSPFLSPHNFSLFHTSSFVSDLFGSKSKKKERRGRSRPAAEAVLLCHSFWFLCVCVCYSHERDFHNSGLAYQLPEAPLFFDSFFSFLSPSFLLFLLSQ